MNHSEVKADLREQPPSSSTAAAGATVIPVVHRGSRSTSNPQLEAEAAEQKAAAAEQKAPSSSTAATATSVVHAAAGRRVHVIEFIAFVRNPNNGHLITSGVVFGHDEPKADDCQPRRGEDRHQRALSRPNLRYGFRSFPMMRNAQKD